MTRKGHAFGAAVYCRLRRGAAGGDGRAVFGVLDVVTDGEVTPSARLSYCRLRRGAAGGDALGVIGGVDVVTRKGHAFGAAVY
ncbi:hypothetical protein AB0E69_29245, partial [Kribbella sp. NPDC026611]|uniref:hypothetical protein n=1 Tax=Kribbella sp. NPDC026611 TaxID=3154911 RepID=UPI0033D09356